VHASHRATLHALRRARGGARARCVHASHRDGCIDYYARTRAIAASSATAPPIVVVVDMKVNVFGAAGQVGRAVLRNMLSHGHSVLAFERSADAWASWEEEDGPPPADVECVYGDIVDFAAVSAAVAGCDAIVHTAVYFPPSVNAMMSDYAAAGLQGGEDSTSEKIWLVNLKGLWNCLESARLAPGGTVKRVVHLGSCNAENPMGVFNGSDVRRPDGSLYAVTKRLQEEMCRQYWEAHKVRTIVLRPDYIMDATLGIGRFKEDLPGDICNLDGWVDRHDLADAVHLCLDSETDHDILHTVHTTMPGGKTPEELCNVGKTKQVLGWKPMADEARMLELRGTPKM
jgi:nucleoside-diphosphate-sugar epimerase